MRSLYSCDTKSRPSGLRIMFRALPQAVAPALATPLRERTEGHALFLVTIVEHLVQQG